MHFNCTQRSFFVSVNNTSLITNVYVRSWQKRSTFFLGFRWSFHSLSIWLCCSSRCLSLWVSFSTSRWHFSFWREKTKQSCCVKNSGILGWLLCIVKAPWMVPRLERCYISLLLWLLLRLSAASQSPAAAAAPWCCFHTGQSSPSSGSRVSAADAAFLPSAASLPAEKTKRPHRERELLNIHPNRVLFFLFSLPTCLIFSLSSEALPVELMRRLFLNMAMRVFASLRWILGMRLFSCCCRAFRISIIRWL